MVCLCVHYCHKHSTCATKISVKNDFFQLALNTGNEDPVTRPSMWRHLPCWPGNPSSSPQTYQETGRGQLQTIVPTVFVSHAPRFPRCVHTQYVVLKRIITFQKSQNHEVSKLKGIMSCWLLTCVAKFAYSKQLSTETNSQSAWASRLWSHVSTTCKPVRKVLKIQREASLRTSPGSFFRPPPSPSSLSPNPGTSVVGICSVKPCSSVSAHFHGDSSYQLLKELACIANKPLLAIGLFSFSISSSICSKALLQKEIGCRCVLFLSSLPSPFVSERGRS